MAAKTKPPGWPDCPVGGRPPVVSKELIEYSVMQGLNMNQDV